VGGKAKWGGAQGVFVHNLFQLILFFPEINFICHCEKTGACLETGVRQARTRLESGLVLHRTALWKQAFFRQPKSNLPHAFSENKS
jgi:hypothetical protein